MDLPIYQSGDNETDFIQTIGIFLAALIKDVLGIRRS